MRDRVLIASAILMSLTGCTNKVWDKYGATEQEFYQDRGECSAMAGTGNYQINTPQQTGAGNFNTSFQQGWNNAAAIGAASASSRIFNDCMMGRGWSLMNEASPKRAEGVPLDSWKPNPQVSTYQAPSETKPASHEQINQAVSLLMGDPFENAQKLTPEEKFWFYLERQVPNFREVNDDPRFHRWLSVTDSTTGKQRQTLLVEAQNRHDADTVAAMFQQFLKTQ